MPLNSSAINPDLPKNPLTVDIMYDVLAVTSTAENKSLLECPLKSDQAFCISCKGVNITSSNGVSAPLISLAYFNLLLTKDLSFSSPSSSDIAPIAPPKIAPPKIPIGPPFNPIMAPVKAPPAVNFNNGKTIDQSILSNSALIF